MIQLKTKQFFFPAKYILNSSSDYSSLTRPVYIALSDVQRRSVLRRQKQLKLSKAINAWHSPKVVSPLLPCPKPFTPYSSSALALKLGRLGDKRACPKTSWKPAEKVMDCS